MQCPQCKRTVGAVAGAARIQCFGCGAIIDVGGKKPARDNAKSGAGLKDATRDGGSATKFMVAIVSFGIGLLLLVGGYFLLSETPPPESPAVVAETTPPGNSEPAAPPEELVPAYVASAEERAAASLVPESIRVQILEMWDRMIATTRKKLLIPKGSVMRNSVEGLMSSIEQREIQTMAALLQIEESDVQAVIQVEMADRAEKALAELENQD